MLFMSLLKPNVTSTWAWAKVHRCLIIWFRFALRSNIINLKERCTHTFLLLQLSINNTNSKEKNNFLLTPKPRATFGSQMTERLFV